MLDELKKEFEQIRQAIADGNRESAIEMLTLRCTAGDPLHDSLILLDTRLSNLQQSVIEGVISREDENIERNSISKGLLQLVKVLEARANHPMEIHERFSTSPKPHPVIEAPKKHFTHRGNTFSRKWVIAAGLMFTIAVSWGIVNWAFKHPAAPMTRDLSLYITVTPSDIPIGPLGKAQIESGNYTSELVNVQPDGSALFKNTPILGEKDAVKLRLPDLKFKHDIANPSHRAQKDLAFQIILKTNTFQGIVLRPDLMPSPNVEIEIEGGLARAITDSEGKFSLVVPDWGATTVQLVMRRAGKVLVNRKIGLSPAVFKELKTPY